MLVPNSKSRTVYFDPLVEYYTVPILIPPIGSPKDAVLTQFFEANEFDSMINRILSDFRYMQPPRKPEDLDRAIVTNNIAITLNTLFRTNRQFYINKKPFTIVGMNWNRDNWQIDTKPMDKMISPYGRTHGNELKSAEITDCP